MYYLGYCVEGEAVFGNALGLRGLWVETGKCQTIWGIHNIRHWLPTSIIYYLEMDETGRFKASSEAREAWG